MSARPLRKLDAGAGAQVRAQTSCPFCGAILAYAYEPRGIVHGIPACTVFASHEPGAYLALAAARVRRDERRARRGHA